MSLNLNKFLNTISSINETINILVENKIIVTPSTVEKKDVEYTIHKNQTDFPNDDGMYITEKEAQTYDINKKVGDTIIIEEVDMSKMSETDMYSWFKDNDISAAEAEQIALAGSSSKVYRMGGKGYRFGKGAAKGAAQLALLRRMKDLPHSICWCGKLFNKHIDPSNGDSDKETYISYLKSEGYIESIVKQFEENWDKCGKKYKSKIRKQDKRVITLKGCSTVESWYGDADAVLNSIVSKLQSYFNISGIKVKDKELGGGLNRTVGEKIGGFKKIKIKFLQDVDCDASICGSVTVIGVNGGYKWFDIINFKRGGDTVVLKRGSNKWVFQFTTDELNKQQSGSLYKWESSGTHGKIVIGWKGEISQLEL